MVFKHYFITKKTRPTKLQYYKCGQLCNIVKHKLVQRVQSSKLLREKNIRENTLKSHKSKVLTYFLMKNYVGIEKYFRILVTKDCFVHKYTHVCIHYP